MLTVNEEALSTFILMIVLLTVMPGPNGALLLKTVPKWGRRAGIYNLIGIVSAFTLHGAFSVLGVSALILSSPPAFLVVKFLGAMYLIYLGVTSLWQAFNQQPVTQSRLVTDKSTRNRQITSLLLEGLLTNLLNPKISMFYLAVFPQFISLDSNPVTKSIILVAIHSIIVTLWFSFVIITVSSVTPVLSSGKFKQFLQGMVGSLMLWFGYHLLIYHQ